MDNFKKAEKAAGIFFLSSIGVYFLCRGIAAIVDASR